MQDQPAGGEGEGDVEDNGGDDGDEGEPVPAFAAVTFFQEIRQSGDLGFQIKRREEEPEQDEGEGGHPLEVAVEQAGIIAGLGEADEVDAGDVGGEERKSDDRPLERVGRHEVVSGDGLTVLLAFFLRVDAGPTAETHHSKEVNDDDGPVECADVHGLVF